MGAWGIGPFEDDHACDLLADIYDCEDKISFFQNELEIISPDELDYDSGTVAIVLGAILDAVLCKTEYNYGFFDESESGEEIQVPFLEWANKLDPEQLLPFVDKIVTMLQRLLAEESELRELWAETEYFPNWKKQYEEMIARLEPHR